MNQKKLEEKSSTFSAIRTFFLDPGKHTKSLKFWIGRIFVGGKESQTQSKLGYISLDFISPLTIKWGKRGEPINEIQEAPHIGKCNQIR